MNQHTMETIRIKKIKIMKIYKKTKIASRQTINNWETRNFVMDMINHNIYTNKIINNIQNKNKKKTKKKIGLLKFIMGCLALIKVTMKSKEEELRKHRNKKSFIGGCNRRISKG